MLFPCPVEGVSTFFPRTGNENVVVRIDASNSNVNQRVSMNSFCRPAKSLAQWVFRRWQLMASQQNARQKSSKVTNKKPRVLGFFRFFEENSPEITCWFNLFLLGSEQMKSRDAWIDVLVYRKMGSHVQHSNFSLFSHLEKIHVPFTTYIPSPWN